MKKVFAAVLALALCLSTIPVPVAAEDVLLIAPGPAASAEVYVTISAAGELVAAYEKVRVVDVDGDAAITINDALCCAHEALYEGGAAAGYASEKSDYGVSLNKLWGVENGGSYGYYVNNASAWSLTDPVSDGDHVYAFTYADLEAWSDSYTWFDSQTVETAVGGEVRLTLSAAGYDADWNPVSMPCEGATVTAGEGEFVTNAAGEVSVKFEKAGTYVVTAFSESATLVPPVCIVTVHPAAMTDEELDVILQATAAHCITAVEQPGEGAEWIIMALAGGGISNMDSYFKAYYAAMEEYAAGKNGVLSGNKYTEYSSAVLGLTAAGFDPADVAGYDLTAPLNDYDGTKRQGLNGPIFALLALDSGDYPCDIREDYVEYILSRRLEDGGWAVSGTVSDADVTAMALQALAKYTHRGDVAEAVEAGLDRLSRLQQENGGFASYGVPNSESTAQVILALCELGVSLQDGRFVKNGRTVLDALLDYRNEDGSFFHTKDGGKNGFATEQAFLALVSVKRQRDGMSGVYHMSDRYELPRFADAADHWAEESILACVDAGLFQGTGEREFSPDLPMNRAMLVTVLWRLEGKPASAKESDFSDVVAGAYYAAAIAWAGETGITAGYADGRFGVSDNVTRQQLALFLCRYAAYKGYDVSAGGNLGQFADGGEVAQWAEQAMGWANGAGLVTGSTDNLLHPGDAATRAQAAVILMRFVEAIP